MLIRQLTQFTVIERSRKGTGFDYWLGSEDEAGELPFQNKVRLEVSGIDLRFADLRNANLQSANLENANLDGTNLKNADLRRARFISIEQIKTARFWREAIYDDDFREKLGLIPSN
jgi:hypothetical protein